MPSNFNGLNVVAEKFGGKLGDWLSQIAQRE
jgi:hypothetical protein